MRAVLPLEWGVFLEPARYAMYGSGSQRGESSQLDGATYRHPKNGQVQLVNIATEEDCTPMPTMAPTLSSAPTLAPTPAPTTYQSDAAPARAVVLPVVAALAAAVM